MKNKPSSILKRMGTLNMPRTAVIEKNYLKEQTTNKQTKEEQKQYTRDQWLRAI